MSRTRAKPVVAIVGRPNVGKSTLFNRLTGTRAALVSDLPGLTRDRKEGEIDLGGHEMVLVDTAGLEESDPGSIPARMRAQTETAIRSSDLVLFVFDSRAGITGADRTFADVVRRSDRPYVLVANKSEGRKSDAGFYEAYELGLGEPVAISAEHGEGLGDLETAALAALDLQPIVEAELSREERRIRRRADRGEAVKRGPDAGAAPLGPEEAAAAADLDLDLEPESDALVMDAGTPVTELVAPAPVRRVKVAIIGRPNAGKSTLVNALLGEERMITGPEPGLTRDSVSSPFAHGGREFLLYDTAGLRRKARITETAEKLAASDSMRALNFAEVVVVLIDATHPLEHQDLILADRVTEEGRALVVAINKWDLVQEKQKALKDIHDTVREKLAQVPGVPVVTVSALGERGLDQLMKAVVHMYETWNRRISTADLNRWLREAVQRHAPPTSSGRRIKIRYMTQASIRPPTFVLFSSQPADLPRSYSRYLENSLRDAFDLPGVPVRLVYKKPANPFAD